MAFTTEQTQGFQFKAAEKGITVAALKDIVLAEAGDRFYQDKNYSTTKSRQKLMADVDEEIYAAMMAEKERILAERAAPPPP